MTHKNVFTKALGIAGILLVWIPLLAPAAFAAAGFAAGRIFRFDYLMPAELFPAALTGGFLLLWAAIRTRSRIRLIGGGLAAAVVCLVSSQALAVTSGLASGERQPPDWPWGLVVVLLVSYIMSLAVTGIGGLWLANDLFRSDKTESPKA